MLKGHIPRAIMGLLLAACGSMPIPTASNVPSLVTPGFVESPTPAPTPTSGPTASPTALPTPAPAGLRVDGMARVTVDRLRQLADPERPNDHALESPGGAGERRLLPLQAGAQVYIVGGPLVVAGTEYWQLADSGFPGCCAPFGWVRALTRSGEVTIEPFEPTCPDMSKTLASGEVARLDGLGQLACFGRTELQLRGALYCGRPTEDGPASLGGTNWVMDQVTCNIDETFPVYGSAVTEIDTETLYPEGFFDLIGHFDDPSSAACRWTPGTFWNVVPEEGGPPETAQFACRTKFVVSHAERIP